jgi:hypothetical protein
MKQHYAMLAENKLNTNEPKEIKITKEYLDNISPSSISPDYKEYKTIDFRADDVEFESKFGKFYKPLVNLFCEEFESDEKELFNSMHLRHDTGEIEHPKPKHASLNFNAHEKQHPSENRHSIHQTRN